MKRVESKGPRDTFTPRTVALMTVPTAEAAEGLRQFLLRGKSIPPIAEIIPISKLDRIRTMLSEVAAGLGDCGVSSPIPPTGNPAGNAYIVLQKGGEPGSSCVRVERNSLEVFQKVNETAGEMFIGLLAVGLTGLLIVLPFILLN